MEFLLRTNTESLSLENNVQDLIRKPKLTYSALNFYSSTLTYCIYVINLNFVRDVVSVPAENWDLNIDCSLRPKR